MSEKIVTRTLVHRPESLRCITRITINHPKRTRGWQVRVIRRGIGLSEFFADAKHGGRAGALSKAMHFRDEKVKELPILPRSRLLRKPSRRNTSGIVGVRRAVQKIRRGERVHTYVVWTASGTPSPGKRKTRHFYVTEKLNEDEAREAAIAQRMKWEQAIERKEAAAASERPERVEEQRPCPFIS